MAVRGWLVFFAACAGTYLGGAKAQAEPATFLRAGAAAVDITPTEFPRIISGGFLENRAERAHDRLFARAIVLDDGRTRLALVVVDTLMMPRPLLDQAKVQAGQRTGIRPECMLISATHTHSAPSVMGALGTPVDEPYAQRLPGWIAECIARAAGRLLPVRVGWATVDLPQYTHCRRWIKRPDRIGIDPFGQATVRAMMHPGYQNPDYVGPAGPKDSQLSVLALWADDSPPGKDAGSATPRGAAPAGGATGWPLAVLANYSMHYYGASPVSADYFGRFCERLARQLQESGSAADGRKAPPPPVVLLSQGTAGDLHWMDYSRPANPPGLDAYANALAQAAFEACKTITWQERVDLAMAERKVTLRRRVPDEGRLAWAQKIVAAMKDRRKPANIPEVYALEQFYLRDDPQAELIVQAIRIGQLGIVALPNEVFGITGLKIKAQSPLQPTFAIELANGAEGYIPPPEQHRLGGYTTWPARTAGLEVQAEPVLVETALGLLEQVSGQKRRRPRLPAGPYVEAVLASRPAAYWRLGDMDVSRAADSTAHCRPAVYEGRVAPYLEGPEAPGVAGVGLIARAAHFAGGKLHASLPSLSNDYAVEFWFWNGLPADARPVTGYLFSRAAGEAADAPGDHLGLGGTAGHAGRLFLYHGRAGKEPCAGTTPIALRTWHHVALVRQGDRVAVYLDGRTKPEIVSVVPAQALGLPANLCFGNRNDDFAGLEGKLAEVAVYDRPLRPEEIATHYAAAIKP